MGEGITIWDFKGLVQSKLLKLLYRHIFVGGGGEIFFGGG